MTDPVALLRQARTIAVVGLTSDTSRPSYRVARYLQSQGYRIIPVNPQETQVLGKKAYPRLQDVPEHIDLVDVFRRAEFTPEVVRDAIEAAADAARLPPGLCNAEGRS